MSDSRDRAISSALSSTDAAMQTLQALKLGEAGTYPIHTVLMLLRAAERILKQHDELPSPPPVPAPPPASAPR